MDALLGRPEDKGNGLFKFPWLQFDRSRLALLSETGYGLAKWKRAWHVCRIEALYSIMHEGCLRASSMRAPGTRITGWG